MLGGNGGMDGTGIAGGGAKRHFKTEPESDPESRQLA